MKIICDNCNQESYYNDLVEIIFDCGYCKICGEEYCVHCGDNETHQKCNFKEDINAKSMRKN